MDRKLTNNKKSILVKLLILSLCVITFLLMRPYIHKDIKEVSYREAKMRKQFHLNIRDGEGQFTIKPFSFSDVGSDSVKVYFKNEGRNEVTVSFFRLNEKGESDNEVIDFVLVGEDKEWVFNNPTSSDADKFMLTIADSSEPMPVVIGEFYITDN